MRALFVLLCPLAACQPEPPCDEYARYLCACRHDSDPAICADLEETWRNADQALQEQCATRLDEEERLDDQAGLECQVDDTWSTEDDWLSSST